MHNSVYDKRTDFGFPFENFPWLSVDAPRLPSCGIYTSQLIRFAMCCTSVLDFHSKNLQITTNSYPRVTDITSLVNNLGFFFISFSGLKSKFGVTCIPFQEYVTKGISHPVFYGDPVYKLKRPRGSNNFISSGTKIVKRLWHRWYDPGIIERTKVQSNTWSLYSHVQTLP